MREFPPDENTVLESKKCDSGSIRIGFLGDEKAARVRNSDDIQKMIWLNLKQRGGQGSTHTIKHKFLEHIAFTFYA